MHKKQNFQGPLPIWIHSYRNSAILHDYPRKIAFPHSVDIYGVLVETPQPILQHIRGTHLLLLYYQLIHNPSTKRRTFHYKSFTIIRL